jgi:hypothetical protein
MGLETAFIIFDNTASFPYDDQKDIVNEIKKQIENDWGFKPDLQARMMVVSTQKRQS